VLLTVVARSHETRFPRILMASPSSFSARQTTNTLEHFPLDLNRGGFPKVVNERVCGMIRSGGKKCRRIRTTCEYE
jgi:hypothetical protein